jgi:type IV secretory pathway TrbD component
MPEQGDNGVREEVPPAGEAIHLPGPSYLPVLVAFGATIVLVGVVLNWVIFGIGMAIMVVAIVRWVSEVRQDMDELPLEH